MRCPLPDGCGPLRCPPCVWGLAEWRGLQRSVVEPADGFVFLNARTCYVLQNQVAVVVAAAMHALGRAFTPLGQMMYSVFQWLPPLARRRAVAEAMQATPDNAGLAPALMRASCGSLVLVALCAAALVAWCIDMDCRGPGAGAATQRDPALPPSDFRVCVLCVYRVQPKMATTISPKKSARNTCCRGCHSVSGALCCLPCLALCSCRVCHPYTHPYTHPYAHTRTQHQLMRPIAGSVARVQALPRLQRRRRVPLLRAVLLALLKTSAEDVRVRYLWCVLQDMLGRGSLVVRLALVRRNRLALSAPHQFRWSIWSARSRRRCWRPCGSWAPPSARGGGRACLFVCSWKRLLAVEV